MKKYGRTYHLPMSPGATSDDKVMSDIDGLKAGTLIVTGDSSGRVKVRVCFWCDVRGVLGLGMRSLRWVMGW